TLDNQMKTTLASLEQIEPLFVRLFPTDLQQLKSALQGYFASLDDYKRSLRAMKEIGPRMTEHANGLLHLTEQLQQNQMVHRDNDSNQARLLQISGALGALLLSLLAAVVITRQITQPLQETLE